MENQQATSLIAFFTELDDPRMERTKRHELSDIIAITILGVLCGADSWVDVELFGNSKREWLERFLEMPNGVPSHDTFGRVFAAIDAEQFQRCFIEWVKGISDITDGQIVAIDGKTLRRSHDRDAGKAAIHMVSAWASANRMVLGQVKVDDKSNEITAIPRLLEMLELNGCIVTIDAMGCQKSISRKIVDEGADYALALKENQVSLHDEVVEMFDQALRTDFAELEHDRYETVEKSRNRMETRRCWAVSDADHILYFNECGEWAKLRSVAMVESERVVDDKRTRQRRYYISSLPGNAKLLLEAVRGHWGIENCVHWSLDVSFGEDASRARKGNSAETLSVIRRMALNLLKQESSLKVGIAAKRKRAGWDTDYLLKVLNH